MLKRKEGRKLLSVLMIVLVLMFPVVHAQQTGTTSPTVVTGPAGPSVPIIITPPPPATTGASGPQLPNPRAVPNVGQPSTIPRPRVPQPVRPGMGGAWILFYQLMNQINAPPTLPPPPGYTPPVVPSAPAVYFPQQSPSGITPNEEQWEIDSNLLMRLQLILHDIDNPDHLGLGKSKHSTPDSGQRVCTAPPANANNQMYGIFAPGVSCSQIQGGDIILSGGISALGDTTPRPTCPQKWCSGTSPGTSGRKTKGACIARSVGSSVVSAIPMGGGSAPITIDQLDQMINTYVTASGGRLARRPNWDHVIRTLRQGISSQDKRIRNLANDIINRMFFSGGCFFILMKTYDCFCYDFDIKLARSTPLLRKLFGGITGGGMPSGTTGGGSGKGITAPLPVLIALGITAAAARPWTPISGSIGSGCDGNTNIAGCQPGACANGLYCRTSDCTCQPNCGNGKLDIGEQCDPPNTPCTDAKGVQGTCSTICQCATSTAPD